MSPKEVDKYFEGDLSKPELKSVQVGNQTVNYAYQDNNKDTTVVFIHGAPGSWSAFVDFFKVNQLKEVVNIISVDRPGYGYSDFGEAVISLESQSKSIMNAVNEIANDHLILVGHSLGGPVAARMMMDFPKKVIGSVLVAPSISPALEKREWYRYIGKLRIVKYMIPATLWVTNEEIYDLKAELQEMMPYWKTIENPVIVIQGTEDDLVPKGNAFFAEEVLSEEVVEINLLEGVNHFIPWSHPDTITEAILKIKNKQTITKKELGGLE